jgi:hypothetical protein
MDLFSTGLDENQNLLPKDGTVFYYGHMMPIQDANFIWKFTGNYSLEKMIGCHFGKLIITKEGRLVWDTTFSYTYSKKLSKSQSGLPNCWR